MTLSPLTEAFVSHFGEMGSRWGFSRAVGQVYALLFVSPSPLCADELVESLGMSRSNVALALKELTSWELVRLRRFAGDRRDFYATPDDVWAIVRTLVEQRKRREVDPTLTILRECLMQEPQTEREAHAHRRMGRMHEIIELMTGWYAEIEKLETERLVQLLGLGSKVVKILEMKDRLTMVPGRKTPLAGQGA